MALIPCPACRRHVYATETTCPFCSHELSGLATSGSRRAPVGRMSRAALVVLGMSSAACGGDAEESAKTSDETNTGSTTTNTMTTSMPSVDGTANAVYGSPAIGFTTDTGSTSGGSPIYGAPATGGNGGAGGAPTGGTGGTGGTDSGGAAGEANDTGIGGSTPLPTTDSGGTPIYGAPPTPD